MKKIFKLMLVLTLVITQFLAVATVNAAENGTIKINATVEQTKDGAVNYSIYKIFDLSINEGSTAFRYTIRSDSEWYDFFNTGSGKDYINLELSVKDGIVDLYVVTWKNEKNKADDYATLAKLALAYAETKGISETVTAVIGEGETSVDVNNLELGYYLVDSTLGALCGLTTTKPVATINEKNTVPTIKKEVKEIEYGSISNAKIGDTVNYRTTITVAAGAIDYVLYDVMEEGLTFNNDIVITVDGNTLVETEGETDGDYTVTLPEDKTFVVTFDNEYIKSLEVGKEIIVTYSAVLNEKAEISKESNDNTTELKYGNGPSFTTEKETTKTYSFKFDLVKTDVNDVLLEGAKFKLYDSRNDGNEILLVKEGDHYRVAMPEEKDQAVLIEGSKATIKGLDGNTTYYLEEVEAPEGYNRLTSRVEVSIKTSNLDAVIKMENNVEEYVEGGVRVINNTGIELPTTGGIGTAMFITIGSLMVMGFGVLLVTKFRLSKEG